MSVHTDKAKERMEKCITALTNHFAKVRTGRANPQILEGISVDYYGQATPISQVAAVKVPEASMLAIEPWDKSLLGAIEKAVAGSDLGITPTNDGSMIRLPFPKPTEERRKELAKECKQLAEDARVAVRNVRRDANHDIEKDDTLAEDDEKREEKAVQKLTDEYIEKIDEMLKTKTSEVMEI